jgi:hypothetical protein
MTENDIDLIPQLIPLSMEKLHGDGVMDYSAALISMKNVH